MIRDKLIPLLEEKFGSGSFSRGNDSKLIVSFPPVHSEVGELRVLDDGNEVIVEIGEITHGHFCSMNAAATKEGAEQEVVANVVDFLEDLFAGKYILWRTKQRGAGGWKHIDFLSQDDKMPNVEIDAIYFTWSGPLNTGKESGVP
jgi:hypothetical protein